VARTNIGRVHRLILTERMKIARGLIGCIWREADCPQELEAPLRDIERAILDCEKLLLAPRPDAPK
jgi:hypothetical protein